MRKIITFLGMKPNETKYELDGQTYSGRVFAEALRQFVVFDEMLVFVTEEARARTWPVLEQLNDPRIRAVSIPTGATDAQIWEMFTVITEQVNAGETVIFDITHSLRSITFLVFLFAAYLKTAKRVHIEAIYYGAFELGNSNTGKPAPVINLSSFVKMLDWITATDQFVYTGVAGRLAALINPAGEKSGALFEASSTLQNISQAAFLCQPFTLMQEVPKLEAALRQAEVELGVTAPPFTILREQIVGAYAQFQDDGQDVARQLRTEFQLVEWYYQKGQLIQVVTLAREWLIDAVTYKLGQPLDFLGDNRKPLEDAIAGVALVGKQHPQERERLFTENDLNVFGHQVQQWENREALKQLWTDLKNIRNPMDHAEHQRKKEKDKSLEALKKMQKKMDENVMPGLRKLAKYWNLA